ncbi:MAG: SDR family NAD(P)-dependent oxidoreductase [Bacteroidota bacterium]|jgi:3-oxoacyl-[acyl-carrier protein] reductase
MKNILLIGASSAIAQKLSEDLNNDHFTIYTISRTALTSTNHYTYEGTITDCTLPEFDFTIDGLVYFPGTINLKPFRSIKPSDVLQEFEINALGAFRCIQYYLKNLSMAENASIVLFSSVAAQTGMPFHSSIAMSKAAIEGLTRSLAAELAPKVRVNCIAPSLTETPLAGRLINTPEKIEQSGKRHPLQRIGNTNDIASMAAFLLSDNSSWMTGQVLKVDGGMSTLKTN